VWKVGKREGEKGEEGGKGADSAGAQGPHCEAAMGDMVRIGRVMGCVPDAHMAMEQLRGNEMHFAVLPLVHPRARREFRQKTSREEPFTRSDLTLSSVSTPSIPLLAPYPLGGRRIPPGPSCSTAVHVSDG